MTRRTHDSGDSQSDLGVPDIIPRNIKTTAKRLGLSNKVSSAQVFKSVYAEHVGKITMVRLLVFQRPTFLLNLRLLQQLYLICRQIKSALVSSNSNINTNY